MRILALAVLLHGALAAADATPPATARALDLTHAEADDASFRGWVTQWASAHHGGVARWGWAQLDEDAAPERFAWVCDTRSVFAGMWILVEDTVGKRWSIAR